MTRALSIKSWVKKKILLNSWFKRTFHRIIDFHFFYFKSIHWCLMCSFRAATNANSCYCAILICILMLHFLFQYLPIVNILLSFLGLYLMIIAAKLWKRKARTITMCPNLAWTRHMDLMNSWISTSNWNTFKISLKTCAILRSRKKLF